LSYGRILELYINVKILPKKERARLLSVLLF